MAIDPFNIDYGMDIPSIEDQPDIYFNPQSGSFQYAGGGTAPRSTLYEGTPNIRGLLSEYEGGEAAALALQDYDLFTEDSLKKQLQAKLDKSLSQIESISSQAFSMKRSTDKLIGKTGFASTGMSQQGQEYIEEATADKLTGIRAGMNVAALSHMKDIRDRRKAYIDELWDAYSDFLRTNPTKKLYEGSDTTASEEALGEVIFEGMGVEGEDTQGGAGATIPDIEANPDPLPPVSNPDNQAGVVSAVEDWWCTYVWNC